jgi:hypothetical protein
MVMNICASDRDPPCLLAESTTEASLGAPTTAKPERAASQRPSIAVLPFANMSGDPEQEVFRRRYFRRHHHGLSEIALVLRDCAQFVVYLQR